MHQKFHALLSDLRIYNEDQSQSKVSSDIVAYDSASGINSFIGIQCHTQMSENAFLIVSSGLKFAG